MNFLTNPTRYLFFTGKGGVGKTSLSCTTAIALADKGYKVFLVCTDPASNLSDVLGVAIGSSRAVHQEVPGLQAVNIDPEKSAEKYRERVIGPYRGKLPDSALTSMEEQLSGACTMEIAAFDEFAGLLGNGEALREFDYVIFDTAPTGHTLRLLQLPSAWDGFFETNTTGTSCLGPLAGLTKQQQMYKETIKTLTSAKLTTVVLVCRADGPSLREAARTSIELSRLGMSNQKLIVNGMFKAVSDDPLALAWEERGQKALAAIPDVLAGIGRALAPLLPFAPLGVAKLRLLWQAMLGGTIQIPASQAFVRDLPPGRQELFNDISKQGKGVIMAMGKGGVGKTTMATELACFLVTKGHKVLLATTDPAAHLDFSLADDVKLLSVARIDPREETKKYAAMVMSEAGRNLDEQGKKLLAEDMRSPCTEEIAVFQAFARMVDQGEDHFIVLDTAPTGHTLLLMDAARAYHREVQRAAQKVPAEVEKLLPRMRDPDYTKIVIVTLPETTPVHEAKQLEKDLQRAGITSYAWIINQSLAPLVVSDPLLQTKQREEIPHIRKLMAEKSARVYLSAWDIRLTGEGGKGMGIEG